MAKLVSWNYFMAFRAEMNANLKGEIKICIKVLFYRLLCAV